MTRISIFPLSGAVLYPGLSLPLHLFEPRYCAMISDSLARDRRIGMIQPRDVAGPSAGHPALFDVGCLGRIGDVEALDGGRFNIVLEGVSRFRIERELTVTTPFRQVEARILEEIETRALAPVERALFEREAQDFARVHGYHVDWEQVSRLDDASLINGVAQIAPFDAASKQALLEAADIPERCSLLVQLMQFHIRRDSDDGAATLQ